MREVMEFILGLIKRLRLLFFLTLLFAVQMGQVYQTDIGQNLTSQNNNTQNVLLTLNSAGYNALSSEKSPLQFLPLKPANAHTQIN